MSITVQELYEWAKEHDALDYDIVYEDDYYGEQTPSKPWYNRYNETVELLN